MTSIAQQLQDALGGVLPTIKGSPAEKRDLLSLSQAGASHAAEAYWTMFGADELKPQERFEIIERLIEKQIATVRELHAAMGLIDPTFDLEVVAAVTSSFRHRLEKLVAFGPGGCA